MIIANVRGIGVALITSICGFSSLIREALPLLHSKSVLLICDHKPQILIFHLSWIRA